MNMSEKKKAMEGHIREQLLATGFPLEIEVSDMMEKADWIVLNNQPYLDEDEDKTREIDIFAIHMTEADQFMTEPRSPFFIATDMIAECKKSSTSVWALFTRFEPPPIGFGEDQILDFLDVHSKGKTSLFDIVDLPNLHYNKFTRIARTYTEVPLSKKSSQPARDKRGSSGKQLIFDASNQLMKYAAMEVQNWHDTKARDLSRRDIVFFFLAIVFDGRLYEATLRRGSMKLKRRSHLLLHTARYSKLQKEPCYYLIDVVTRSHLPEYLRLIDSDIQVLRSFFKSKEDQLLDKADAEMKVLEPGVFVSPKRSLQRVHM